MSTTVYIFVKKRKILSEYTLVSGAVTYHIYLDNKARYAVQTMQI